MEKDWSLLIKNYREKSKLTQRQLASISGLSQSQINRLESGKSTIKQLAFLQRRTSSRTRKWV